MSVYTEKPNTVTIKLSDESEDAFLYVIGKRIEEIVAEVERAFGVESTVASKTNKTRKPRRTKAQMAAAVAAADLASQPEDVPPPHTKAKKSVWPEGDK